MFIWHNRDSVHVYVDSTAVYVRVPPERTVATLRPLKMLPLETDEIYNSYELFNATVVQCLILNIIYVALVYRVVKTVDY